VKAGRKKAKAKPKSKKAKKSAASAETTTMGAATSAKTETPSVGERDLGTLIKSLDIASLRNDDVTAILLHCASVLNLRKVIESPGFTMSQSSASYCYTKSGDSSRVSIWSGGFKVGETTESDAKASGIPPCG
jgi:hypothetical protein